jgi:HPt (histidine-containing phosphotransfer) domain-containing protein
MEQPSPHRDFVFSNAINSQYIIDLYAGDYIMIEETFTDVLREYNGFVERILISYRENDRQALKSAVHKIKPLFGFVGLTSIQALCLEFENSCQDAPDALLAASFPQLETQFLQARGIIEKEKNRLVDFNGQ